MPASKQPLSLSSLTPNKGARHRRKRVARGTSSGWGKTAGRGHKGQKSRSGGVKRPGFEGGQTPIYRRLPKLRGFKNYLFQKKFEVVNVGDLATFSGSLTKISPTEMKELGLIRGKHPVKILGNGDFTKSLHILAFTASKSAIKKIEAAGGKFEVVAG